MRKIDKLKDELLRDQPYFGMLLSTITVYEKKPKDFPALAGIGVDPKLKNLVMYIREDLYKLPLKQQIAILIHELYHVLFSHVYAMGTISPEDRMILNIAADITINQEIPNLPKEGEFSGVFVEDFGFPLKLSTQEYFILLKQLQKEQLKESGFDNHGSGSPEADKEFVEACKNAVLKAEHMAKTARANTDKSIQAHIDQIVNKCRRNVVREIMSKTFKRSLQAKDLEKTYTRESRRYQDFPGNKIEERPKILFGIDTSGSITPDLLSDSCDILLKLAKAMSATIEVAYWHTEVYSTFKLNKASDLEVNIQEGGTDVNDFLRLAKNRKADLTVVVTDGIFDMPPDADKKIVWVLNQKNETFNQPRTVKGY